MIKRKYIFSMVLFILAVAALWQWPLRYAQADKIKIDPPPLLWEERAEDKKQNDAEYWKRKYNLKPKPKAPKNDAEGDNGKEAKDADGQAVPEEQGDIPMHKMNKPKGIMDNSVDDKTEGSDSNEDEEKGGVVVKEDKTPPCDFEDLIAKNIKDIDFDIFNNRPVRVVYVGQNITRDINKERINIKLAKDGTITKVACF